MEFALGAASAVTRLTFSTSVARVFTFDAAAHTVITFSLETRSKSRFAQAGALSVKQERRLRKWTTPFTLIFAAACEAIFFALGAPILTRIVSSLRAASQSVETFSLLSPEVLVVISTSHAELPILRTTTPAASFARDITREA